MKGKLLVLGGDQLVALVVARVSPRIRGPHRERGRRSTPARERGAISLAGSAGDCKKGDTPLTWNTVGPQGADRRTGPRRCAGAGRRHRRRPGRRRGNARGDRAEAGSFGDSPMILIGMSHEIVSPRDAASGQATGKRMHKPFVITKELDKATPLLLNALTTNENLTSVLIALRSRTASRWRRSS